MAKLQVSLADFRRLCIFKGIYPREPRNKRKASKVAVNPQTFYYTKDIKYLMHEPVLQKFREYKVFSRRLNRAIAKNELHGAQLLEKKKPRYRLDHLVRERYPTFLDALRDLDDPLNMLFLFANMPATNAVSHRATAQALKLANQWLAYVAKQRLISKVFVSIKGVYYEAQVKGQDVRWLVPFKFPANIPSDVDFRIMSTFLEFYSTMVHFVLYKLYSDADLVYPPPIDADKLKGIGGLSAYVLQTKDQMPVAVQPEAPAASVAAKQLSEEEINEAKKADQAVEEEDAAAAEAESVDDVELDAFTSTSSRTPGDLLSQPSEYSERSSMFEGLTFYVGREVPLDILELCILAAGGKLVSEIALDDLKLSDPAKYKTLDLSAITHHIVDRPKLAQKLANRTYIQPQWVFDSINNGLLVSVNAYAPGETLPPHLSPWGDAGSYNPTAPSKDEETDDEDVSDSNSDGNDGDDGNEEADEDVEQKELEMEAKGVQFSEAKPAKVRKSSKKAKEDDADLRTIVMGSKQKRMYNELKEEQDKKEERVRNLTKKRKQLDKAKKPKK